LLLGGLINLGGIGGLYAGNTAIGVIQLVASLVGWICGVCLFWLVFPLIIPVGTWVWSIVDGIIMLTGRPTDGEGRLLRG
jgi:hypothetical protein